MQKRSLMLFTICLLLITMIMGGCSNMQSKTTTIPQKYPTKPITMIVPFSAGGGMDLIARAVEKLAPKYLGQPLIVINKSGGAGTIGWNELASASPDGYTLGISAANLLIQQLYGPTKYHYPTALEPLVQISTTPFIMVVRADQPWQDIDGVIKYAKQHPGQLKFGHAGIGTPTHIVGEAFAKASGITLEQVPFRGNSESTVALLGKHIEIVIVNPASVKEHIKNGTLSALAITGEQRLTDPDLAQIPTFKEQGFDIQLTTWYGVAAPKGLPPAVKATLAEGFKAIISDPEFRDSIEQLGLQIEYLNPKESEEKWLSDGEKTTTTIQQTGILDQIKAQKN